MSQTVHSVGSTMPLSALKADDQGPHERLLDSLVDHKSAAVFVPPRRSRRRANPRHDPLQLQDAAKVVSTAWSPGTEELPTSFCTQSVRPNSSFWVSKSKQSDPFLQKMLAAKNLNLERLPFRDACLFQYGSLPDQYTPHGDDRPASLHPCDKIDDKLPTSLVQMTAKKQLENGSSPLSAVSAWDGTTKNITAPLLWRNREPLF
ncbi:unnamed protein product [Ectocarpus sp. 12 AP-2014]